jgi:hypothetical protein
MLWRLAGRPLWEVISNAVSVAATRWWSTTHVATGIVQSVREPLEPLGLKLASRKCST